MVKETYYIKFYVLCRSEQKLQINDLIAELNKLFNLTKLPVRSTIQKWIKEYGETKDKNEKNLSFDDFKFKELNFRVDNTQSNIVKAMQFFSLCRFQLKEEISTILAEMKKLFDKNAPDLVTFNIWILNLFNASFSHKSVEMNTRSMTKLDTDESTKIIEDENSNLKQKINQLETTIADLNSKNTDQEKKIVDQLGYILRLETDLNKVKSSNFLNDSDYLTFDETMNIENLFIYDQDLKQKVDNLEETLRVEREDNEIHVQDLTDRIQQYIKERNDYRFKFEYQMKLNQDVTFKSEKHLLEFKKNNELQLDKIRKEFERTIDDLKEKNQFLTQKSKTAEYEIFEKNERISKLKKELAYEKKTANNYEKKFQTAYEKYNDLKDLNTDLSNSNKSFELDLIKFERVNIKLKEDIQALRQKLIDAEDAVKEKSNKCFIFKKENIMLQEHNKRLQSIIENKVTEKVTDSVLVNIQYSSSSDSDDVFEQTSINLNKKRQLSMNDYETDGKKYKKI